MAAIIKGVRDNRFMVFTSLDIRIGYWFQRKFAWPYELVMRLMNDQFARVARRVRQDKKPGCPLWEALLRRRFREKVGAIAPPT